jgi:hypothetical protein
LGKRVGFYIRCRRRERNLGYGQVAELLGVTRPTAKNKLCRSLAALEQGCYTPELLQRVFDALNLGDEQAAAILNLAMQEEAEYQKYLDDPVERRLTVRFAAAIYTSSKVPQHMTDEQAIEWAKEYLTKYPVRACLMLSRRRRIWFKEHGIVESEDQVQPNQPDAPAMQIGSQRFFFKKD